ncbi:hypothetical protein H5T89_05910 [bacterium]|nr:hypothetical protein [bacterium]
MRRCFRYSEMGGKVNFEGRVIAAIIKWSISCYRDCIEIGSFEDLYVKVVPGHLVWRGSAYIEWASVDEAINMRLKEDIAVDLTLSDSKSGKSYSVKAQLGFPGILDFLKGIPDSREEVDFRILGEFPLDPKI